MNRVDIIDPAQDERWDPFVKKHPFGWVAHLSGWKRVLETSFPHMKGHYFVVVDPQTNEIRAGLPVFEIRSWLTGNRLVSIPFATLSDPLVSNPADMEALLQAARNLLEKMSFSYLEIKSYQAVPFIGKKNLVDGCFFKHHYLDLAKGPEALWGNFNYKAVRYEINKAQKQKLAVRAADSENDFAQFYQLYTLTRKRLGLPSQPRLFFKTLWDTFLPSGNVVILLAELEGMTIAAHFLLRFNGRVSAEAVGWDTGHSRTSPNHFLFWEGIKSACANGFRVYDFGRTSPRNRSLLDFKKRWGTQVADLHSFCHPLRSYSGIVDRESSKAYQAARFACRKAPDFAYSFIGNVCYRHLG